MVLSIGMGGELLKNPTMRLRDVALLCWLPIAAFVTYCGYLAALIAASGGWTPPFAPGAFHNFLPAALAVGIAGIIVFLVPAIPFALIAWVFAGFRSRT
jgi:hypothetical protein